jgi:hypothetical protein
MRTSANLIFFQYSIWIGKMKRLKMLVTGKLVNSVSNNFAKIIVSPFKFFAPNLSELTCVLAIATWRCQSTLPGLYCDNLCNIPYRQKVAMTWVTLLPYFWNKVHQGYNHRDRQACTSDTESVMSNVGDPEPDPDPQDPHVFGPPVSGSISQSNGTGSGSKPFPFLIKVLSGPK